ncbi:hypothetical protein RGCCGE502_22020 [Rhizobium grahamii CCGE 502]|uniref:Uncharacterized protein n=1 Tax=Rhizobium grahamii CCGE 502 TaxID=990285 RepID=S3HC39_9HYPH|nr:hypothetical protein RGCCGE502_22020 [Rhizobium grahamii CCGE 502]
MRREADENLAFNAPTEPYPASGTDSSGNPAIGLGGIELKYPLSCWPEMMIPARNGAQCTDRKNLGVGYSEEKNVTLATLVTKALSKDSTYVFGRFHSIRIAYSAARRAAEYFQPPQWRAGTWSFPTLFPAADVPEIVKSIRKEAVFVGLNLPAYVVEEIKEFALRQPLHAIYDPNGPTFRYSDVSDGTAADGRRMPVGGVSNPERCPAVQRLIDDPVLRSIVREYFGHEPRKIIALLHWSFGSPMDDEERRHLKHIVIDYHYDVDGYNLLYASFYITDTDRYSGAHVMMKRSHNRKPLRMLIGSVRASVDAVYKYFGKENEIIIEGPAGTGFVQDTSCYHRASPPTRGDRLMLAIRFIN